MGRFQSHEYHHAQEHEHDGLLLSRGVDSRGLVLETRRATSRGLGQIQYNAHSGCSSEAVRGHNPNVYVALLRTSQCYTGSGQWGAREYIQAQSESGPEGRK